MRCCVALFTKPAVPGRVKTRLVGAPSPALSPEQAAALHAAFLWDVTLELSRGSFDLQIAWALDGEAQPARTLEASSELLPLPVPALVQRGSDLGARLFQTLSELARCGYEGVAAVGSDHPEMRVATVEGAFERLASGSDVVVCPASDGGYTLIAVRASKLRSRLFEGIAWSGAQVLETTVQRCREQGLEVFQLPGADDCDTPEDLEALCRRLAESSYGCTRTRALLEDWGLLRTSGACENPTTP